MGSLAAALGDLEAAVAALQAKYGTTDPPPPPPPPPADAPLYGPADFDWPADTPTLDDRITVVVPPDVGAVNAALPSLAAGAVLGVSDGVMAGGTIAAVAGFTDRADRVLIRPVNPFGVRVDGLLKNSCGGTTLAAFRGDGVYLQGEGNQAVARIIVSANGNITVNGVDTGEIVDCAKSERGQLPSGDSADLKSPNSGANPPTRNFSIRGLWLEGIALEPGGDGHNDVLQILALSGVNEIKRSYLGQGGNSTTVLFKLDFQGSNPYPDVLLEDVYIAPCDATADFMWYVYGGGSLTMRRVVSEGTVHLRLPNSTTWQPGSPVVFEDVTGRALSWIGSDGKGHVDNGLIPGFTAAESTRPTFSPPSWWPAAA